MNKETIIDRLAEEFVSAKGTKAAHITTGGVVSVAGGIARVKLPGAREENSSPVRLISGLEVEKGHKLLIIYEGSRYFGIGKL